jgi:hypothetical protein
LLQPKTCLTSLEGLENLGRTIDFGVIEPFQVPQSWIRYL